MFERAARDTPPSKIRIAGQLQFRVWLERHLHSLIFTFGQIVRNPVNSSMTAIVIGVVLSMPAALFVLLENVTRLTERWQGGAQISLYLEHGFASSHAEALLGDLSRHEQIERVALITPEQALAEYQELTGFYGLKDALGEENPLPGVIIVFLNPIAATPSVVGQLTRELGTRAGVELVQSDLKWLQRLHAFIGLVDRGIAVVAALFGLGALLIVGNTIRLGVQSRHEEIEITKLVGGTNAFVRRPFLYGGFWYGVLGAVVAWLVVAAIFELLRGPVSGLAELYHSEFRLTGPGIGPVLALLVGGAVLGLAGSWLAVSRQLQRI